MPEGEKSPVEKAMEKDCIILLAANELVTAMISILRYPYPEWFGEDYANEASIDTKCRGPACGQYIEFINKCGFAK